MTNEYENSQQLAYPGVYPSENEIIPYSPRKEFRFMQPNETMNEYENLQQLAYPGVYPDDNKLIGYSPRKEFKFMDNMTIKLESMREMSIDQIVELYKNGYRIEDTSTIMTQNGVTVSSDVILLVGIGILAYVYLKKHPEKL